MGDFRKLEVWKQAHQLALRVYGASAGMPARDRYELASQLRRSAASVVSNIAEGAGRNGDAEFVRFLSISLGSANELATQVLLAKDLGAMRGEEVDTLLEGTTRIRRMLSGLIRRLSSRR